MEPVASCFVRVCFVLVDRAHVHVLSLSLSLSFSLLVFFALVFGRAENPKMEVDPVPLSETWAAMEELVDAGLAKDIGVSNFNCQLLADLLSYARIKPSVNQVHC